MGAGRFPATLFAHTAGGRLATADDDAEQQADAGGDADGLPGVLVHEVVGGACGGLGLVDQRGFGVGQADLGVAQTVLDALAQLADLLAGGAGRGAQDFFRVGDDDLHVGDDFLLVDVGQIDGFGHDKPHVGNETD